MVDRAGTARQAMPPCEDGAEVVAMSTRAKLSAVTLIAIVVVVALAPSVFGQGATITFLHVNDVYEISPCEDAAGSHPS